MVHQTGRGRGRINGRDIDDDADEKGLPAVL
jgi:hypothetical protein